MSDPDLILLGLLIVIGIPGLAIAALVVSLGTRTRIAALERQTREIETSLARLDTRLTGAASALPSAPVSLPDRNAPQQDATTGPVAPSSVLPPPLPPEALGPAAMPSPSESPPDPVRPSPRVEPPPKRGFEESIGTRWTVWIGGLALAFGGLFLVKYSIDEGYFTPPFRIALAAVFSLLLIGLGEHLRRRGENATAGAPIPAILTAAARSRPMQPCSRPMRSIFSSATARPLSCLDA